MSVMNLTAEPAGVLAGDLHIVTNGNAVLTGDEGNTNFRLHTSENIRMSNDLRQQSAVFEARFSRCREMLCFLACRVLGSPEQVHGVVENCRITASRNPPRFEYEGAFPQLARKSSY
jgi:hypothetical protein